MKYSSKESRLKQCKFYHGESKFPESLLNSGNNFAFLFWNAENEYVNLSDTPRELEAVNNFLELGINGGTYDVQLSLQAFIFEYLLHIDGQSNKSTEESIVDFEERVFPNYLQST